MSTLADHADRLARLADAIRTNAAAAGRQEDERNVASGSSAGPFTRAVLHTPLGDLIRDIDPSELGLFTVVQPSSHGAHHVAQEEAPAAQKAEIARVTLPIATPLRRPPAMHKKQGGQKPGEHDPEVYAHAALKFLDRYQSIRPMPRYQEQAERILDQMEVLRDNIRTLNEQMKQSSLSDPHAPQISPKSIARNEERRISEAQARIQELKKQKEALLQKTKPGGASKGPKSAKAKPDPSEAPPTDAQEQDFWNTPGAAARTLHFTGELLTDEQIDVAEMSGSLDSPLPAAPRVRGTRSGALQFTSKEPERDASVESEVHAEPEEPDEPEDLHVSEEAGEDGDATVMLQRPPVDNGGRSSRSPPESVPAHTPAEDASRRNKVKVTVELENIVAKIWSTVGEVIMPGHPFDPSGSTAAKPPRAKETMSHLQSISTQVPSLGSPSVSSLSSLSAGAPASLPTSQQVLTARMLLALLNSPPNYSMSLNALKDALSTAEGAAAGVTRPIYACVAKRLLKIDRGGGEQVVRFDV